MASPPKNNRQTGERWFTCDRSGFEYPISRRRFQNGLQVADDFYDEPGYQSDAADPRIIQMSETERPDDG